MLRCVCQAFKPAITSALHVNLDCNVWCVCVQWDLKWSLLWFTRSLLLISHCICPQHSLLSSEGAMFSWISLVQSTSINTKSQNTWGIWSSNETRPDAPNSSGQAQIKNTTRPFYHSPLTRPKKHPLARKAVTLVLTVYTVLCNFCTHRHYLHL